MLCLSAFYGGLISALLDADFYMKRLKFYLKHRINDRLPFWL